MPDPANLSPRPPSWKWLVCGLLLLATMLNYMDRLTLNLSAARIMGEFGLDERQYGQLESAFAFAFAVGAIIFGWMADRWNVSLLYPLAVLAWSAAGFATGLAQTFLGLLLCRSLLGLAESGNWPCALRTTQHLLAPSQRSMGNSLLQSGAAVGAIVTPLIVAWLVLEGSPAKYPTWVAGAVGGLGAAGQTGAPFAGALPGALAPVYHPGAWRHPFMIVGAVGASWVLLWFLFVRRADLAIERRASPSLIGIVGWLVLLLGLDIALQVAQAEDARLKVPWVTLPVKLGVSGLGIAAVALWLFRCTRADAEGEALPRRDFVRRFWVLVVLVVAVNIAWHFFRAWLPLILEKGRGYDEATTSWFTMAYYIATDAGSLTAGATALFLARRGMTVHGSRVSVFAVCAALTALSVWVAFLGRGPLLLGLLLVIGFAALGLFPVYYSFSQELTTRHQGKLTGSLGCICWLSMYALHALVGESVKATGSYSLGVALAGLAPLVGLAALVGFWGRRAPRTEKAMEAAS
ncbi:MAG TPA: MFS transporter, partial [Gemmataceae bacterium]|nr:MFS transporter [Gemmataceae bacterium]